MNGITKLIQGENQESILHFIEELNDTKRLEMIRFLSGINVEHLILDKLPDNTSYSKESQAIRKQYYDNRKKLYARFQFALLVCIRSKKEITPTIEEHLVALIRNPQTVLDSIIQFYKNNPLDYLDAFLDKQKKREFFFPDFHLLWLLYENDFISFDESFFVNSLLVVLMFDRSTVADANFLMKHPKALSQVFLKFYKYETPVLDISKWQGKNQYECTKVTKYWTEVLEIIQDNGVEIPRNLVTHLLGTLNYNWKKPHINWHVSILKKLKPTKQEYLENQDYLWAAIISENNTVVNYIISVVKSIYKLEGFDTAAFLQNLDGIFIKEKFDKSILTTLKIVDYFLENNKEWQASFSENLILGLIQSNAETQAAFAVMLEKYIPQNKLKDLIEPYTSVLKSKAKEILAIQETITISLPQIEKKEFIPLKKLDNWMDLLYHIGLCIKTKSAADIEIFFEALLQLQEQIPDNFQEQIKPYTKRLFNTHSENYAIINFAEFLRNWTQQNKKYTIDEEWRKKETRLPFLRHKCIRTFHQLQKTDALPFLSTPTHAPFYVHPEILIDKLLIHEKNKANVDIDDLIIAANRILIIDISEEMIEKVNKIKGNYKDAIKYLLGISDSIKIEENLIALWSQVLRTKNPDKTFEELSEYNAGKYPSATKPFYIEYTIEKDNYWHRLILNEKWNRLRWDTTPSYFSKRKIHTYTASFELAYREDIYYQMSFLPHYIDPLLCRYIPDTGSNNEVGEIEQCLYPLQYLLEQQIIVRHSGWIYIAQCLIFEKRISRDLAREYLMFALANKTMNQDYFSDVIANMIAKKYTPVKRLTESLEETDSPKKLKELYFLIASKCIQSFHPKEKPRSYKKIITSYKELQKELGIPLDDTLESIIKTLK